MSENEIYEQFIGVFTYVCLSRWPFNRQGVILSLSKMNPLGISGVIYIFFQMNFNNLICQGTGRLFEKIFCNFFLVLYILVLMPRKVVF